VKNQISFATTVPLAFVHSARQFLREEYLPKIESCLQRLNDQEIWWRPNSASNSVGNLILHLSGNARQWIISGLGGEADRRLRQSEFAEESALSKEELLSLLRETLAEVDNVLAQFNPERILGRHLIQGSDVTALEAVFHVTEHFSMHTGQIILLTKMLGGRDLKFYDFPAGVPVHNWKKSELKEN